MPFVELIRDGVHTILNESVILSVFHDSREALSYNTNSQNLPPVEAGNFVLVIETSNGTFHYPYQDEMQCVAAYEEAKKALSPKVILLPKSQ